MAQFNQPQPVFIFLVVFFETRAAVVKRSFRRRFRGSPTIAIIPWVSGLIVIGIFVVIVVAGTVQAWIRVFVLSSPMVFVFDGALEIFKPELGGSGLWIRRRFVASPLCRMKSKSFRLQAVWERDDGEWID